MLKIMLVIIAAAAVAVTAVGATGGVVHQAYCDVHPDWNNYTAGQGAWGHLERDWVGPCQPTAEAARADAAEHDARYHASRDEYQADPAVVAGEIFKNKAGVKVLRVGDCFPNN